MRKSLLKLINQICLSCLLVDRNTSICQRFKYNQHSALTCALIRANVHRTESCTCLLASKRRLKGQRASIMCINYFINHTLINFQICGCCFSRAYRSDLQYVALNVKREACVCLCARVAFKSFLQSLELQEIWSPSPISGSFVAGVFLCSKVTAGKPFKAHVIYRAQTGWPPLLPLGSLWILRLQFLLAACPTPPPCG